MAGLIYKVKVIFFPGGVKPDSCPFFSGIDKECLKLCCLHRRAGASTAPGAQALPSPGPPQQLGNCTSGIFAGQVKYFRFPFQPGYLNFGSVFVKAFLL